MTFDYVGYITNFVGRNWNGVVVHHSATPDGRTNDWEGIRAWHTGKIGSTDPKSLNYNPYIINPMDDIGYHFGIEFDAGRLCVYRGRDMMKDGAHTRGHNNNYLGICLVGNFDISEPSHQQYWLVASVTRELMRRFGIPIIEVRPHWMFADKTCPGKYFNMLKLKEDYIKGIGKVPTIKIIA